MSSIDDYRWLVSAEGGRWLENATDLCEQHDLVIVTERLRKDLPAEKTHLVLQQIELRQRAAAKFLQAGQMLFTPRGLEQSSGEAVALHKAARFGLVTRIGDLCCGIGGDLLALGDRGPVVGVDKDESTAVLAKANARLCKSHFAEVVCEDVMAMDVASFDALHIDPDRRDAAGRRKTTISRLAPDERQLGQLIASVADSAVKLAPATELPASWTASCEREWISHSRECKQQVAWFGELAKASGRRSASVLDNAGRLLSRLVEQEAPAAKVAAKVGGYLYEPDSAVIAAGLTDTLAAKHDLAAVASGVAYFTSDSPVREPELQSFEVLACLPFDRRRLKRELASRNIGRLEVKKRGVAVRPEELAQQMRSNGDESATLVLFAREGTVAAVLCRRTRPDE